MEQELISWIKKRAVESRETFESKAVLLGIGDDGAILHESKSKSVLVSDTIVEGVHFDSKKDELGLIGHKAIAVNLSDIAAMGAVAETALVSVVLPKMWTIESAKQVLDGLIDTASRYKVTIIGGDTVRHSGGLMVCVSGTGTLPSSFIVSSGWRMSGAKVDDVVVVTGALGGSILGKHLKFEPRLELASAIQQRAKIHCATDISDSLTIDLAHVLRQSDVGAVLNENEIPISKAAEKIAASSSRSPLQHALSDGEDFELLLTMSKDSLKRLTDDDSFQFQLFPIGKIVTDHCGKIFSASSGQEIRPVGYEH